MEHTESVDYLRERITHLVKKELSYIVIGFFVVISAGLYIAMSVVDSESLIKNFKTFSFGQSPDTKMSTNTDSIEKMLGAKTIDYISPQPTTKETPPQRVESGQTSSIASTQVTYTQNKYIILEGESLADVAAKVYGDPNAWVRIAQANNIDNPDQIEVGMELVIPR